MSINKKQEIKKTEDKKEPEKRVETIHESSLQKERDEYKNKYLRALADYQNFEKRISEEKDLIRNSANMNLIIRLLPILDGLNQAEVFVKDPGLKIVKDSFNKLLSDFGLEEIEVMGKVYDPYSAEAIEMVAGEKDNVVVEILRKGYKLNNKVIRVAQVKVSKKL